jgi:hypothetical protein
LNILEEIIGGFIIYAAIEVIILYSIVLIGDSSQENSK